ncbi:MAG TPA: hypothetical protein VE987_14090 [Polyangiaceae bacterium]|nr:hypothetical protein [Polyangiaceae bacterium]
MIARTIPLFALLVAAVSSAPALAATTSSASAAQTTAQDEGSSACACAAPFASATVSPLANRAYIADVTPYRVITTDKRRQTLLEGATIKVVAVPGVTREWLQRVVDAHVGDNASSADAGWDPLAVPGASAIVKPARDGFEITIMGDEHGGAKEVLRRADALVTR